MIKLEDFENYIEVIELASYHVKSIVIQLVLEVNVSDCTTIYKVVVMNNKTTEFENHKTLESAIYHYNKRIEQLD